MSKIILPPILTLLIGLGFGMSKSIPESSNKSYIYPEHLTGTFTGGFGEETCRSCHFDYPLNYEEATLSLDGFPDQYEPDKSYTIRIQLARAGLAKAGFQLSARYADGRQAGAFSLQPNRTQFTESAPDSIQYLQHSAEGTEITGDESTEWHIEWTAPSPGNGNIYIHLAANAANGDASEFGDYILSDSLALLPSSP